MATSQLTGRDVSALLTSDLLISVHSALDGYGGGGCHARAALPLPFDSSTAPVCRILSVLMCEGGPTKKAEHPVHAFVLAHEKDFSIEICGKYFIFRLPSEPNSTPDPENTMLWICSACTAGCWCGTECGAEADGVNQLQDPFKMAGNDEGHLRDYVTHWPQPCNDG